MRREGRKTRMSLADRGIKVVRSRARVGPSRKYESIHTDVQHQLGIHAFTFLLPPSLRESPRLLPPSLRDSPRLLPPSFRESPRLLPPSLRDSPRLLPPSLRDSPRLLPPSLRDSPRLLPPSFRESPRLLPPSLRDRPRLLPPSLRESPRLLSLFSSSSSRVSISEPWPRTARGRSAIGELSRPEIETS
jgi:hypothetical protein